MLIVLAPGDIGDGVRKSGDLGGIVFHPARLDVPNPGEVDTDFIRTGKKKFLPIIGELETLDTGRDLLEAVFFLGCLVVD